MSFESQVTSHGSWLMAQSSRLTAPKLYNTDMSKLIEYDEASPEVRAVYDDIRATRKSDFINNFWKAIAVNPQNLRRAWQHTKEIMTGPGSIDPLVREMIYIAVSVTNGCEYCIASHTVAARNKGLTPEMFGDMMAIIGLANENNRLVKGYQVEIDAAFK